MLLQMHTLLTKPYLLTGLLYFGSTSSPLEFFSPTLPKYHFSKTRERVPAEVSVMDFNSVSTLQVLLCLMGSLSEWRRCHFMAMDRIHKEPELPIKTAVLLYVYHWAEDHGRNFFQIKGEFQSWKSQTGCRLFVSFNNTWDGIWWREASCSFWVNSTLVF